MALLRLPRRLQQSSEGCRCLGALQVELLPEGRQVGLIDPDAMEFHRGDRRQTAPLQRGGLCQSGRLQGREEDLTQAQEDRRIRRRILELVRRQCPAPVAILAPPCQVRMQEMLDHIRQAMASRMQSGIEQLGSQHRIDEQSLDRQPGLAEKLRSNLALWKILTMPGCVSTSL